jgi:flavin reductase (DIM6/NTAB) family NADH-FMN oxidoreductase RutF/MFS family permease
MLFDFAALSAQDRYKLLISTIVPRPIAWVVSLDAQGRRNAAPFSFFNALVGDPPVVAVGIGGRRPEDAPGTWKDSGANIRATGEFVVNLVGYANREAMNITAIELPHDVDELAQAGLTTLPSVKVRPPRIAESPVAFECERLSIVEVAVDRAIVLGRVLARRLRARRKALLYRHAETRPDRPHAWRRLVFPHHRPVRNAAHPGGSVEGARLSATTFLPPILRPLRDPALAALWGGLATSAVGEQLFSVALAWIAVGAFGPAAGYLTALQAATVLATALLGGRWADRREHRRLMIACDLARAAVLAGVVTVWLARGAPPAWTLIFAVLALAAGQAFFRPALQATIPAVVADPARLPAANALLDSTDRIARLLGPGIVSMLSGLLPLVHFLTLNAGTFLGSAVALVLVGRLRPLARIAPPERRTALASALHGFAALRSLPLLFYVLVTNGVVLGAWYAGMFLGVPLLLRGVGADVGAFGLVIASYGSTNLLATLVIGSFGVPRRPAWIVFGGLFVLGAGMALLGAAGLAGLPRAWLVPALCAAAALGAIGGPMEDVAVAVLRQTRLPRTEQAAVTRAFLANGNLGTLLAFLIAPRVFAALGTAPTIILCGGVLLAVAAIGMLRHRHADA